MKIYILRNNTIEQLFGNKDVTYSGYDDISCCPSDADLYLWFYQVPIKYDSHMLSSEILSYADKLSLVVDSISEEKNIIVFTLADLYGVKFIGNCFNVYEAISKFNETVIEISRRKSNVKVLDINDFFNLCDRNNIIDWKYYFISQMIINPKLSSSFKKWFQRQLEIIELKRKKCIVLDLDNTLWGGVLGEDGIEGIKVGGDYPGKAYLYFQEALVELSKTGVILTVCSKNNEKDVFDAWERNPFIILNKKYISAYRINWNNKADNIRELASELNIGLDSFIFIDDNPTERELIRQMLPMVETPDFPEHPYQLPVFFKSIVDNYFKVYDVTDEDTKKTEQYKANAQRANEQKKFSAFSDYLRSLEIRIDINQADEFNIPRIAQMTQKTNQFNLTTKRYSDAEVRSFIKDGWKIFCISVADKFGDNGITGTIFIKVEKDVATIDSLLLSCRILGKGVETAFLKSVLLLLKNEGINKLNARYIQSSKNSQVADFYDKCGFILLSEDDNSKFYIIDLNQADLSTEDYYTITIK